MRIIKLALAIFLFQALFLLCVSCFSDEISLSAILMNFWSKFINGTDSTDPDSYSETNLEMWIYLFFSIARCLCNFATIEKKRRKSIDGIQTLQFLLTSSLSCYLFFLDLWLTMNKGFKSYFIILPIFSFISLALDFNLLVRWLGSGVAFVFQIFCTLGSICMFTVNKGSYWLFVPYIMIPAFDILRTLFQSTMRTKCDSSMYFEQLLPTFFLIAYIKPLGGTYPILYPPETKVVDTCGVFLLLGLLLVGFQKLFQRKSFQAQKIDLSTKNLGQEDTCSICLEKLIENKKDYKEKDKAKYNACRNFIIGFFYRIKSVIVNRIKKKHFEVLKTPCDHYFHKGCLEKWFQNKVECPYCRNELDKYGKLGLSF